MYKFSIFIILFFAAQVAVSQNLVPNPGFENHGKIICMGCIDQDEFGHLVKGWRNIGMYAQVHSTNYEFNNTERERGYSKSTYIPYRGNALVMIPVGLMDNRGNVVGGGNSGYLYAKLLLSLQKEYFYSIRLWIKIRDNAGNKKSIDFPFLKNFGITFSEDKPKTTDQYPYPDLIKSNSPFLLDTVEIGKWIQINYVIQPTIVLDYVIIGWFDNPDAPSYRRNDYGISRFEFFIDEIYVGKLESPEKEVIDKAIKFPFKNFAHKKILSQFSIINKFNTIYFDDAAFYLTDESKLSLDSLAKKIKKDSIAYIYRIEGHTDSTGSYNYNKLLSIKRAESVKSYLVGEKGFPVWQFEIEGLGDEKPVASNTTEEDRKLNRRVCINKSSTRFSNKIYRLASKAAINDKPDSSIYYLQLWLRLADTDKILLLFDPDLNNLRKENKWKAIEYFVENFYEKYKKPSLAFELESLYCKDQLFRDLPDLYENAKGYIPQGLDMGFLELKQLGLENSEDYINETLNVLKSGWPAPWEVGKRAAIVPLLVLIHSQNLALRKQFLQDVEQAWKDGKLESKWYAMYFDRIMTDEQGIQRYGTQYAPSAEDPLEYKLVPLEFPDGVDSLRAEIGLPPKSLYWFRVVDKKG